MIYIAYGSNMNVEQMGIRCPKATIISLGHLADWKLVFKGVADMVPEKGAMCHVGMWEITADCERVLDRYEGYNPNHPTEGLYRKIYFGDDNEYMAYVMNDYGIQPPSRFYYEGIRQGFEDFGAEIALLEAALDHSLEYRDQDKGYVKKSERKKMKPVDPKTKPKPAKTKTKKKSAKTKAKKKKKGRKYGSAFTPKKKKFWSPDKNTPELPF